MVARKWQQRPAREAGAPLSTECTPGAGSRRQTRRQGIPGPSRGADGPPGLHEHPTCPQGTPAAEGCFPAGPQGPHLGDTWHLWSHVCPGGPPARAHRLRDKASVAWPLCGCSGGRASPLSAAGLQSGLSGLSQLGPSDSCRASSQPLPASRVAFPGLASGLLEGGLRPRAFPRFCSGGDLLPVASEKSYSSRTGPLLREPVAWPQASSS